MGELGRRMKAKGRIVPCTSPCPAARNVNVKDTAQVCLSGYALQVKARPPRIFRCATEWTEAFNLEEFLDEQAKAAATELGLPLEHVRPNLKFQLTDRNGCPAKPQQAHTTTTFVTLTFSVLASTCHISKSSASCLELRLDDSDAVDVLCAIASLDGLPSEHTRLALEVLAMEARTGKHKIVATACWTAGHRDAGVREQALELLTRMCLLSDGDDELAEVRRLMWKW